MSRLVIISNRLPMNVEKRKDGVSYHPSVGGLATGISSLSEPKKRVWFGWPGMASDKLTKVDRDRIEEGLTERGCWPIFLRGQEIKEYYQGFSNGTVWPLFHYFTEYTIFEERWWEAYEKVNQKFCDEIVPELKKGDIVWVHDYQLMLLPRMIREKRPDAKIGFFLHIPFPSYELLRLLPWRTEILEGILGADLVGFHEYDYVRHFLSSVYRITGHEPHLSKMLVDGRLVKVDAFPMGIDFGKFAGSKEEAGVKAAIGKIDAHGTRVIVSVDRLDYTKGILKRLEAYDAFLTEHAEYRGKVSMVMIAVPSRTDVKHYGILRDEIERTVGRINGTYATMGWTPVSYMYRSLPFDELAAMYNIADVALITPLRDGMNLVAKEFVACQAGKERQGVLILSEMAGAACEMAEAVVVNPHDKVGIVEAIRFALEMGQEERGRRNALMNDRLSRYTVFRWANDFIESLDAVKAEQDRSLTAKFTAKAQGKVVKSYKNAESRLILLDFDGTLMPFFLQPADARPDEELLRILRKLAGDGRNEVVVVSGRDNDTLEAWLGGLGVSLVAEHGAFYRMKGGDWKPAGHLEREWKEIIRPMLEFYVDRTPGSFVEEKKYSLVWHCRKSEPDLAKLRTQELKDSVGMMTANLNIGVFEGNKIVEIKCASVNKGNAVHRWLDEKAWEFVFCAGDDYTDEDMFLVLDEKAVSCKVGKESSHAKFRVSTVKQMREFLKKL